MPLCRSPERKYLRGALLISKIKRMIGKIKQKIVAQLIGNVLAVTQLMLLDNERLL